MLPRLGLALLLAGCAADTGTLPANRFIDRDIEASRSGDGQDARDLRPVFPGLAPPTRGSDSFAPSGNAYGRF
jgi:hypothetical protein